MYIFHEYCTRFATTMLHGWQCMVSRMWVDLYTSLLVREIFSSSCVNAYYLHKNICSGLLLVINLEEEVPPLPPPPLPSVDQTSVS